MIVRRRSLVSGDWEFFTMDPKPLFIARCEQLEELLKSNDELSAIDLSRILRQLLVDQHSLVHTVNVNKIPIRFLVNKFREMPQGLPPLTFGLLEDGLDPDTSPPIYPPPVELTLGDFLNCVVLIINGQQHTVKDIIRFAANVAGGIHHDPKPKVEYAAIKAFSEMFGIGGLPAGSRQLRAISRVTLKALSPLINDVKKQSSPPT